MRRGAAALLGLAAILGGCADQGNDPLKPADRTTAPLATAPVLPPPEAPGAAPARPPGPTAATEAPHIYMALQQASGGRVSVVFAIDAARDNTPSNDPAVRITPEDGKCNPQQMRRFNFPGDFAARPIYSEIELQGGVTADLLPAFLAIAVSTEMLERGLVREPDEVKPQNVCTRKLWEQQIVNASLAGAPGPAPGG